MLHNSSFVGFAQGTLVLMSNGQWKPIEYIREGDIVLSFDPKDKELDFSPKTVTATFSGIMHECIEIKTDEMTTIVGRDQLFFNSDHSWVKGYETRSILNYEKNPVKVEVKKVTRGKWKIYDIEVEDNHSLVADGLLAHNKNKIMELIKGNPEKTNDKGNPGKTNDTKAANTANPIISSPATPGANPQIIGWTKPAPAVKNPDTSSQPIRTCATPRPVTQPAPIIPPPPQNVLIDRVDNVSSGIASTTNRILAEDKGGTKFEVNGKKQFQVGKEKAKDFKNEIKSDMRDLETLKSQYLAQGIDTTYIDDAINELKGMKKKIEKNKLLNRKPFVKATDRIEDLMVKIKNQIPSRVLPPPDDVTPTPPPGGDDPVIVPQPNPVPTITVSPVISPVFNNNVDPGPTVYNNTTNNITNYNGPVRPPEDIYKGCYPITVIKPPFRPRPIYPSPETYSTDRVYETDINYQYFISAPAGNRYYFDAPNSPASPQLSWYRHYDPDRGQYYYDRVSAGASGGINYRDNMTYDTPPPRLPLGPILPVRQVGAPRTRIPVTF